VLLQRSENGKQLGKGGGKFGIGVGVLDIGKYIVMSLCILDPVNTIL
jgi:hypothetical protein